MKRNVIIGIAAVLLIVGAVSLFLLTRGDSSDSPATKSSTQSADGDPTFAPLATLGSSYEATYSFTGEDGTASTGTIAVDKNGDSKYSGKAEGSSFELYTIGDDAISCTDGTCYRLATGGESSEAVDSDDYSYTDDDYADFKNNAAYKGTDSCPSGTCSVWEITDVDNTIITMYIDSDNRVSKVMGSDEDGKFEVSYNYKSVSISAPANVTELPSYQY